MKEFFVAFQYVPPEFFSYLMSHLCCMATTFPTDVYPIWYFKVATDHHRAVSRPCHGYKIIPVCLSIGFRAVAAKRLAIPVTPPSGGASFCSGAHFPKSGGLDFNEEVSSRAFQRRMTPQSLSNIGVSYTVGKPSSSATQWNCKLWKSRGTQTCIRVHVMGATAFWPRGGQWIQYGGRGRKECRIFMNKRLEQKSHDLFGVGVLTLL